jgi:predicted nuclease of predicted toxin-antitoxin system
VRDEDVLELAVRESRVLLTQDKDFGELAFRRGLPADCGIARLRFPPVPRLVTDYAVRVLTPQTDLRGQFVVVEEQRVRHRLIPAAK